ncbi:DNA (cytosine-5-)-methyltransferase [Malaciobacter molluscorum]|uniref:DNA (cytosine-5-)-methyltransferase n=1 Tax=Malaciobacter molluscorum TaxID=1032072 RepID=UPI00100BD6D3|nr:DNA (cytosine-5-)-methyltransferase [Malaciobacter molluscorum]RXJ93759.1 DNA (cytosine-5-)-methyltransferase [Malaciobacter molluscorum]
MSKQFNFIDLFAGIGGFRLALEELNGNCVFSSEIDIFAQNTYYENFKERPFGDITKINEKEIPNHDILCGGFPCQPFSIAGLRKGFEDTRGTLFFDILRILKEKKPKAFILENVKGLKNHDKGNTFKVIESNLKELNYEVYHKILNTKDYNIPQNRERIFIIGFHKEKVNNFHKFTFPDKINSTFKLENIIDYNNKSSDITETVKKHLKSHIENNKIKERNKYTIITEVRPSRCSSRSDNISPCLTAKMGTGGNNIPIVLDLKRKITEIEALQIMGFPKSFKLPNSKHQSFKQIGNSVSPKIVKLLGEEIIKVL